ncbi:helicase associated domain-containing protein [Peterkaempfera sp. SMS 1(5)a]|uniref:helicase associated domain-containing protein n=1 Tax=Peterkaempfera podocarpi TaxID=3232308 RepID=UPI00366E4E20
MALGIDHDPVAVAARAAATAPRRSQAERFQQGLAALAAFVEREGHARVSRTHEEPLQGTGGASTAFSLGVWINNVRARRTKFTEEQTTVLDTLGMRWT